MHRLNFKGLTIIQLSSVHHFYSQFNITGVIFLIKRSVLKYSWFQWSLSFSKGASHFPHPTFYTLLNSVYTLQFQCSRLSKVHSSILDIFHFLHSAPPRTNFFEWFCKWWQLHTQSGTKLSFQHVCTAILKQLWLKSSEFSTDNHPEVFFASRRATLYQKEVT